MRSRPALRTIAVILSLGATLGATPILTSAASASSTQTSRFYLAVGASESVGVQPSMNSSHGHPTTEGYANDLVALEAARGITLQLTQLGCPGESTSTVISGADRCYHTGDSQLADAVAFLAAHYDQPGLVSIDLGFNDLRSCIHHEFTDLTCVNTQIANVRTQLTSIVQTLRAAAGPQVIFVGLNHNDPFLASAINSSHDVNFAINSSYAIDALNAALRDVYQSFNIPVADVAGFFANANRIPVRVAHLGRVPTNEARACTWTWMCRNGAGGPNMHPNDTGYQVIAGAIAAALPPLN
ncbi:MAG TPA: SGNH/GDSL hydrolase family protein [Acidimicrobiales bacterium]|nr:SGNH/GDSL hydrolase family protein [Acidimicrobiales bacterium]